MQQRRVKEGKSRFKTAWRAKPGEEFAQGVAEFEVDMGQLQNEVMVAGTRKQGD